LLRTLLLLLLLLLLLPPPPPPPPLLIQQQDSTRIYRVRPRQRCGSLCGLPHRLHGSWTLTLY
jgi:hypothetical protein